MNEKTTFARVVPAMIQDKSGDWILQKLDECISELDRFGADNPIERRHLDSLANRAEFYGNMLNKAFIAQYADKETTEGDNSVTVNSRDE